MWYWIFKHLLIGPWLRLLFRITVEGEEHIPRSGAAILAGNHLSFSDSFFTPLRVHRRMTFLAKAEYFTGTGPKGVLSRWFFSSAGQVAIDRTSGSAARDALETGKRVLQQGKLLGIYPEGTRSPDGRLYRGKTGVARMALESGAPVIPVAMIGSDTVQPPGKLLPKFGGRITIRFGRPLDFSRYEGMAGDRFVERSVTDEIMYELMSLSGQEYVDVYAAKVKTALARGRSLEEATERAGVHAAATAERSPASQVG
ncbi:MAG: 1-acyl-sn-glycerol-3-phosphate acyltransferase [Actinobacteria bacterium]|nr:1-acyl-sn-glycerol-3-phosphate acyltransferase [Actinomycetota bacterium]